MNATEAMVDVVRRWTATYTRGLPDLTASRREAELEADLHDHVQHSRQHDRAEWSTALEIAARLVRGLPADLIWRRTVRSSSGGTSLLEMVGATMARKVKVPLIALGWVVAIVAIGQFIEGYLYSGPVVQAHPGVIAIWLVFGALLAMPGRIASRSVLLTAAIVLIVVAALGQLALPSGMTRPPTSSSDLAWASSYYTWIAAGVVMTQGLWGTRPAGREAKDRRTDGEPSQRQV